MSRPSTPVPLVSIVIVAYNSRRYLERCLPSIASQNISHEIIVVDNASTDDVAGWLREIDPDARLIELPINAGFAAAANCGVRAASGRYVLVLNPDTVLHAGALTEMLRVAEGRPGAFVNPKLVQPDGTLNACGNRMHLAGITTCIGLGSDPDAYHGVLPIPILSGAAILTERASWLAMGGFDEGLFLYMEDTDLSLRARLLGHELLCAADAIVTHDYTLKMSPDKLYYLERNRLLTLLKTYSWETLLRLIPSILLTEVATWLYAAIKGPPYLAARGRGYAWLWKHRAGWLAARRAVQEARREPDDTILAEMSIALPLQALLGSSRSVVMLESVSGSVYRRIVPGRSPFTP